MRLKRDSKDVIKNVLRATERMSKLADYSKFDHLESSSDTEDTSQPDTAKSSGSSQRQQPTPGSSNANAKSGPDPVIRRNPTNGKRFIFEHASNPIYEFEQSLNEVVLYVPAPSNVAPANIVCRIAAHHLQLGLTGADRFFLDEDTGGAVDTTESTWCLEEDDGVKKITIYLQKMAKAMVWPAALSGKFDAKMDPFSLEQVKKDIMLERFQEEHPGMDFRDADFSGSVPDPRHFMGGASYD